MTDIFVYKNTTLGDLRNIVDNGLNGETIYFDGQRHIITDAALVTAGMEELNVIYFVWKSDMIPTYRYLLIPNTGAYVLDKLFLSNSGPVPTGCVEDLLKGYSSHPYEVLLRGYSSHPNEVLFKE